MVRRHINGEYVWGTVCDDDFTSTSAKAACFTLGLNGGTITTRAAAIGDKEYDFRDRDTDPMKIWMDNVKCASSTDNFLMCPHDDPALRSCDHWEDVFLTCT